MCEKLRNGTFLAEGAAVTMISAYDLRRAWQSKVYKDVAEDEYPFARRGYG